MLRLQSCQSYSGSHGTEKTSSLLPVTQTPAFAHHQTCFEGYGTLRLSVLQHHVPHEWHPYDIVCSALGLCQLCMCNTFQPCILQHSVCISGKHCMCKLPTLCCVGVAMCTLYMFVSHGELALHTNIAKLVQRLAV